MALLLEISTPNALILSKAVDAVEVPLLDGDATILCGHRPMACLIDAGILSYCCAGKRDSIAIDGGFLYLQNDHIALMVDQAINVISIDHQEAEKARQRAEEALECAKRECMDAGEIAKLEAKVRYQVAKQNAKKYS